MAFDTFLKFDDGASIKGESMADGHAQEIELYSFSWGASNPVTVSSGIAGMSAGKSSSSSFSCMKKTDASSAALFLACATGKHILTATITMRKATGDGGQAAFLVYTFSNVMIESVQWSGSSGGDDTPTESVSIAFAKVQIQYHKQDEAAGTLAIAGDVTYDWSTVKKG